MWFLYPEIAKAPFADNVALSECNALKHTHVQCQQMGFNGAVSRPCTFCKAVARSSYISETVVANSIKQSLLKRHLVGQSISQPRALHVPMVKVDKQKVTPFQAVKLTSASETIVQTLKQRYLNMRKTVTESLFQSHAEKFTFFTYRIAICNVRCV